MPNVNNQNNERKFAQSGHPGSDLFRMSYFSFQSQHKQESGTKRNIQFFFEEAIF
jgi:hypothetical protein